MQSLRGPGGTQRQKSPRLSPPPPRRDAPRQPEGDGQGDRTGVLPRRSRSSGSSTVPGRVEEGLAWQASMATDPLLRGSREPRSQPRMAEGNSRPAETRPDAAN